MKVLTSEPDDMNEADAVLIADVIDSIVLLDDSLNEVKNTIRRYSPKSDRTVRYRTLPSDKMSATSTLGRYYYT